MGDIQGPTWLTIKGGLLVVLGLIVEHPSLEVAALPAVAVWAFARASYFAFRVIEHDGDPGSRHAGLASVARRLPARTVSETEADRPRPGPSP